MPTDLIFVTGDLADAEINRRLATGRARRLGTGIYTTDVRTPAVDIVARHWRTILARSLPGSVLVDRTAVTAMPTSGFVFIDAHSTGRVRPLKLPGLTVVPRQGPGRLTGDLPVEDGLWLSSQARALADNTRRTRGRGPRPPATLTDLELADWIDHLAQLEGPERLGRLRAEADRLAATTGTSETIGRASELIGAAIGTQQVRSPSARLRARQAGTPFDADRTAMFDALTAHLQTVAPRSLPEGEPRRREHEAFFEAYFSNYIEGTVLSLVDAESVLYRQEPLPSQPEDAHDVSATFALASDEVERSAVPRSAEDFTDLLLRRHEVLMAARSDKHPGRFKTVPNRVGTHVFVAPDLVPGTLAQGWRRLDRLADPFHRAVMAMFIVAEVHPFDDGNGRLARLMMNAELSAAAETRIIVPPVYRGEYISSLSALSNNRRPDALERVLAFAQRWTAQLDFSTLPTATAMLEATNAFVDQAVALQEGVKLRLPSSIPAAELP